MAQPSAENARRESQPPGRGAEAEQERTPAQARHGSYRAGFTFGIMSFLAVAVFGVASTIATARIYGVHIIGQFAIVSAPVATLWLVSTAKEQAALIKEITSLQPRHPRVTQLFAAVFTFSCGLTVVMALIVAGVSALVFRGPLHHPGLVAPMLVSLAGYTLVTNTGWNIDSIFSAFVAGRQLFWVRLHETLSFLTIAMALGLLWHSVWGLVAATIGASLTALIHRVIAVRPFVRARLSGAAYREGMDALPGLLRFGLKITPGGIAQGVSQQVGIWAIALVAPVATVGAYSRAQNVPERLQQVNYRIVEVLYPTLVGRRARGDHSGFDRALLDTTRYALVGMLLIASVCGGAAHGILSVFGPGFARAAPAFALLIAFPALATITSAQTQALWSVDRPGLTSVTSIARVSATVALTLLLTPRLGIVGPAIALLAGYLLEMAWKTVVLLPFLSGPLHETWPARQRVAVAVAYAFGFVASRSIERLAPSLGGLLLSLVAGTLAYVAALFLAGGTNERDRRRVGELVGTVRARRAHARALQGDPAPIRG
ncbi:MAG TPA: lipopolysaccharide biosynthesis protein [Solirubrobacteraceae bacterium]|nr:lipopolysaccharide biosynthesis protein [Solirubrobacteraceae bacterium]